MPQNPVKHNISDTRSQASLNDENPFTSRCSLCGANNWVEAIERYWLFQ